MPDDIDRTVRPGDDQNKKHAERAAAIQKTKDDAKQGGDKQPPDSSKIDGIGI